MTWPLAMPTTLPAYGEDGSACTSRQMRSATSLFSRNVSRSSMRHLQTRRRVRVYPEAGEPGNAAWRQPLSHRSRPNRAGLSFQRAAVPRGLQRVDAGDELLAQLLVGV